VTVGAGLSISYAEKDPLKQNSAIRQLIEGRSNAVGLCTLSSNAASTQITAVNCGPNSAVFLFPTTANAASVAATTYVASTSVFPGRFVVSHASNGNTDKTFFYVCLG